MNLKLMLKEAKKGAKIVSMRWGVSYYPATTKPLSTDILFELDLEAAKLKKARERELRLNGRVRGYYEPKVAKSRDIKPEDNRFYSGGSYDTYISLVNKS